MKLNSLLITVLLSLTAVVSGLEIDNSWQIVCAANALPTEKKAAADTALYIKKISGLNLEIVKKAAPGKKAIIVKRNTALPDEAWDVRTVPEGILISGGVPNGMLYACGEFLEHALGYRFLSFDAEFIPVKKKIIIPDNFKRAGKPFFEGRYFYRGYNTRGGVEYNVRFKLNSAIWGGPEWGWYAKTVDDQSCHTYHLYSSKFPKDKPQWLSLHTNGRRLLPVSGVGPGQLCLTQPDSQQFIFNEMVKKIETERALLKSQNRPFSRIIDLSANDNTQKCVCSNCLAAAKRYGGYSGAMLEFTNAIADKLAKAYPDMQLQTFAYEHTEQAPLRNIAPRKNVLIQLAQLGGEFSSVSNVNRDSMRPIDHPNNRTARKQFLGWSRFGTPIKIWDYWTIYNQRRNFPYTPVSILAPNLRFYANHNVKRIFGESESVMGGNLISAQNFYDLTNYLTAKLMTDPFQDEKKIIADFMHHYYGPAANAMTKLLDFITEAMKKESGNIGSIGIGASYLTRKFFEDSEKIFAEAEKAAGSNRVILDRIGIERISFDEAALELHRKLQLKSDRKKLFERYAANYTRAFYRYGNEKYIKAYKKKLKQHLDIMSKQIPVPDQFAGKRFFDFPIFSQLNVEVVYSRYVDDPEAAGGK
ncbi:MAG: DUF4838 domain-containing protein, partial [Lentisphaeria bacterium]|nr:DUF4838 domain-containing protein [Lentisphaeria bacterium]